LKKIIEVSGLKKSYGKIEAVKDISFSVQLGTVFAFLGPNGAGKSTTIDIICTLLKPDRGSVTIDGCVLGREDNKIRSAIGVVFQENMLDHLLTVKENLSLRARFYGLSGTEAGTAVQSAMEAAGALDFADRPYGKLSGGQKRRADIARALVNTPKILFLDEPTTGLDPQTRKSVWETIQSLQAKNGMTVFLTSHYMEEAANAHYITIIDNGKISAEGTPLELREKYSSDYLRIKPIDNIIFQRFLTDKNIKYKETNNIFSILIARTKDAVPIIRECADNIDSLEVISGTMDDVFINITGKEIR